MTSDKDAEPVFVKAAMNIQNPYNEKNFLTIRAIIIRKDFNSFNNTLIT
jgi:hypothetical protein